MVSSSAAGTRGVGVGAGVRGCRRYGEPDIDAELHDQQRIDAVHSPVPVHIHVAAHLFDQTRVQLQYEESVDAVHGAVAVGVPGA